MFKTTVLLISVRIYSDYALQWSGNSTSLRIRKLEKHLEVSAYHTGANKLERVFQPPVFRPRLLSLFLISLKNIL